MRYRAIVEYDGTNYSGFQRQLTKPTVQGEIEKALLEISRLAVSVTGAGRTDSGVHATGQIIAFDLNWRHGSSSLLKALNANLPVDIVIRDISAASEDFHPRFDALSRTYTYYIYNQTVRSPIWRLRSWHVTRPLDVELMNGAAELIIGEHDFATFGQAPQGTNTIRNIKNARWQKEGLQITFRIEANAFLDRMVRSLVGSMKAVGEGSWTVVDFYNAFLAKDRGKAAMTAPAAGLFLTSVSYE